MFFSEEIFLVYSAISQGSEWTESCPGFILLDLLVIQTLIKLNICLKDNKSSWRLRGLIRVYKLKKCGLSLGGGDQCRKVYLEASN